MSDRPACVSLFSGIGGLDEGLRRAGFRHLLMCESEPWRRDVLRARFPEVPIADDVRSVAVSRDELRPDGDAAAGQWWSDRRSAVDLLAGGSPCQDLSVAGRRAGLDGSRSGLFFEMARVIDAVRPRWVLWENVPGALSSNGGRDFGVVLGTLADLGYGLAWRVLDSRFFGVPQRRRRVFVVGARADGDPSAAAVRAGEVLAVGSRCPRHPATGGEARPEPAVASLSGLGSGGPDDNDGQGGRLIASTLKANGHDASEDGSGRQNLVAAPLTSGGHPNSNAPGRRKEDDENLVPYIFDWQAGGGGNDDSFRGKSRAWIDDKPGRARSLVKNKTLSVHTAASVRRLTPVECCRLQGLPDWWFDGVPGTSDSKMYAGLGDAVTATVAEWVGRRIAWQASLARR